HAQSIRLGRALKRVQGRVFGLFKVELIKDLGAKKGRYYSLQYAGWHQAGGVEPFPEAANTDEACEPSPSAEDIAAS
ncbi:MAG: hypothetical protein AAFR01_10785, partial [Pseudomonadota bacterium]